VDKIQERFAGAPVSCNISCDDIIMVNFELYFMTAGNRISLVIDSSMLTEN